VTYSTNRALAHHVLVRPANPHLHHRARRDRRPGSVRRRPGNTDAGPYGIGALALGAVATPQQAIPALPFTAGAHEHVELAATITVTPTTAVQQLNPIDIPASGYFRSLFIEIVGAGGSGGTLAADGPWNIISSLALKDVNGSHIISPIDGFALWVANLFGGYDFNNNLGNVPWFVGSAPNPAFGIRVPWKSSHARPGRARQPEQRGELQAGTGNQQHRRNGVVAFTTPPTFTIRVWYEGWTLPAAQSMRGEPQSQVPPLLGTGSTSTP
jgi:hypothetical protein